MIQLAIAYLYPYEGQALISIHTREQIIEMVKFWNNGKNNRQSL